jgi:hypothetical protein
LRGRDRRAAQQGKSAAQCGQSSPAAQDENAQAPSRAFAQPLPPPETTCDARAYTQRAFLPISLYIHVLHNPMKVPC